MALIMSQNCNKALEKFEKRYSVAYPTGAERIFFLPRVTTIVVVLMHEMKDLCRCVGFENKKCKKEENVVFVLM